ncbi:MAG: HD domain-containing protein [Ruminococcaceae bacterium]|nr:HD domain-containing protein [Oscillospiraceae bacterium]
MNYDKNTYLADLRNRLDDYRFTHSVNVAHTCRELAKMYGEDEEKAWYTGLLHDIFKNETKENTLAFFAENNIVLTDCERNAPKLWHAMAGSVYLQKTYGFDEEFIRAVRYHTTGRANMSLLEKIVFCADFISAERNYPGVDDMRERVKVSLEYCMEEGLRFTIDELVNALLPVHPDTIHAFNDICIHKERRKENG